MHEQKSQYDISVEGWQIMAFENREEAAKLKLRVQELEAVHTAPKFHWLEPPSLQTKLAESRDECQRLRKQLEMATFYHDQAHQRSVKATKEANEARSRLKNAQVYREKLHKKFHIGPRDIEKLRNWHDCCVKTASPCSSAVDLLRMSEMEKYNSKESIAKMEQHVEDMKAASEHNVAVNELTNQFSALHLFSRERQLQRQVNDQNNEIDTSRAEVAAKDKDLPAKRAELGQLRAEVAAKDNDLLAKRAEIGQLRAAGATKSREVEQKTAEIARLQGEQNKKDRELEQRAPKIAKLEQDGAVKDEKLGQKSARVASLEEKLRDKDLEIARLIAESAGKSKNIEKLKHDFSEFSQQLSDLRPQKDSVDKELGALKAIHAKCPKMSTADDMEVESTPQSAEAERASTEEMDIDSLQSSVDDQALIILALKDELKQTRDSRDTWKRAAEGSRSDMKDHEMPDASESSQQIEARLRDTIGGQFNQLISSFKSEVAKLQTKNAELHNVIADTKAALAQAKILAQAADPSHNSSKVLQEIRRLKKLNQELNNELGGLKADTTSQREMARLKKERQDLRQELKDLKDDVRAKSIKRSQDEAERMNARKAREKRRQDEQAEQAKARQTVNTQLKEAKAEIAKLQEENKGLKEGSGSGGKGDEKNTGDSQSRPPKRHTPDIDEEQGGDSMEGMAQKRLKFDSDQS